MRYSPQDRWRWLEPIAGSIALLSVVLCIFAYWQHQQSHLDALRQQIADLEQKPKEEVLLRKEVLLLQKERIALQNTINGSMVQAIGGFLLFATAYLGWRNLRATQRNVAIAAEKQITDRYTQAIQHLGSDSIAIRFGGIHVLERIARECPQEHWTIMQVLTSYVQTRSALADISLRPPISEPFRIARDIQACLSVIANRRSHQDPPHQSANLTTRLNLIETNLCGAELSHANLCHALLLKSNLSEAFLVHANFSGANLSQAILSNSVLEDANLRQARLFQTQLQNANLRRADLRGAIGLTVAQVQAANYWQEAIYDEDFRQQLGLELGRSQIKNPRP